MNAPSIIYALRWLVRDTFRQAMATRIFWIMLLVSGLCIVFCLGMSIEGGGDIRPEGDYLYNPKTDEPLVGPSTDLGKLNLMFGAFRVHLFRDARAQVELIQVILGTWVAGAAGLLLALVWTAGFLPEALQPGSASILFAKPVPRSLFLIGKYIGVVLFVAFQALVFFVGTWLAIGIKTNIWLYGYLAGAPLLVLHFAAIYGFSVFLAVCTRSTVACVLGSVLFWIVCMCLNYGRHSAVALPHLAKEATPLPPVTSTVVEVAYWVLPKPVDIIIALEDSLRASSHKATISSLPDIEKVRELGRFDEGLSLLTSFGFTVLILGLSCVQLRKTDY